MKRLNICIDIDGTITEPYYFLELTNKYFNKNIKKEQVTQYALDKVFGVTMEAFDVFYEKYKYELHSTQTIRSQCREVLDRLSHQNNLYIISAREKSMESFTCKFLKDNLIPFDEIYLLGSHNKLAKAKELNSHIFIEDSYSNAKYLAESGFKVLLLDTYYNRYEDMENIIRVQDWKDIEKYIDEMFLNTAV